jgi:hypothetical protein
MGKAKDLSAPISRMEEGQLTCLNTGIYEIFYGYNVGFTVVYLCELNKTDELYVFRSV